MKKWLFLKGLIDGFGSKLTVFILGKTGRESVFYGIQQRKSSFLDYKTLFCNQDYDQTLFLVVFLGGTNKEKIKFSYKKYGFTPVEKLDFLDIEIIFGSESWVNPFGKI